MFPTTDTAWTAASCFEERVPKHVRKVHRMLVELVEVAVVEGNDLGCAVNKQGGTQMFEKTEKLKKKRTCSSWSGCGKKWAVPRQTLPCPRHPHFKFQ